jgi:hypothetical protein
MFFLPLVLELAASFLLLLISYQDWQTRSVSWPAFPLLAVCLVASRFLRQPAIVIAWDSGCNLLLIGLLLATLALYVSWRFRSTGLRLSDCLGLGDILFWLILAGYLTPPDLLLFLLSSSMVGVLLVGLRVVRPLPDQVTLTVPLAGIQAACLLALLTVRWLQPGFWSWLY